MYGSEKNWETRISIPQDCKFQSGGSVTHLVVTLTPRERSFESRTRVRRDASRGCLGAMREPIERVLVVQTFQIRLRVCPL